MLLMLQEIVLDGRDWLYKEGDVALHKQQKGEL